MWVWSLHQWPHTSGGECFLSILGRERGGRCCYFTTVDLTVGSVSSRWRRDSCDAPGVMWLLRLYVRHMVLGARKSMGLQVSAVKRRSKQIYSWWMTERYTENLIVDTELLQYHDWGDQSVNCLSKSRNLPGTLPTWAPSLGTIGFKERTNLPHTFLWF